MAPHFPAPAPASWKINLVLGAHHSSFMDFASLIFHCWRARYLLVLALKRYLLLLVAMTGLPHSCMGTW
jgi:hypothetical protein